MAERAYTGFEATDESLRIGQEPDPMARLRAIVAELQPQAKDYDEHCALVTERLQREVALRIVLADELIGRQVRVLCRDNAHTHRNHLRVVAGEWEPSERMAAAAMARLKTESMYAWTLPISGKRLGDAERSDILAAHEFHAKQAKGNAVKAEFYRRIDAAMKGKRGKTVRAVLSEDEIARILAECGGGE